MVPVAAARINGRLAHTGIVENPLLLYVAHHIILVRMLLGLVNFWHFAPNRITSYVAGTRQLHALCSQPHHIVCCWDSSTSCSLLSRLMAKPTNRPGECFVGAILSPEILKSRNQRYTEANGPQFSRQNAPININGKRYYGGP